MKSHLASFARVCAASLLLASLAAAQSTPVRTTDSVTPQNGSGGSQVFTFVFSSSAGYQDVFNFFPHILFSDGGSSGTDYCWFGISQGGVVLAQDNLQSAWQGVNYGANAVAQNSQCLVSGAGSSISFSGNTVTVNVAITFRPAWAGMKTIYSNFNSSNQGYIQVGTYNVTATAPDFTISISPASQGAQAGQNVTYTVTATPVNGFSSDISLSFDRVSSGSSSSGVSGTLSPAVIPAGNGASTLTITVDASVATSNWTLLVTGTSSTWVHNVTAQLAVTGAPPPPPPTRTVSVSPQNGSGGSQVFTFNFTDSNGYQDVFNSTPHILFTNGGSSGTDYCWFIFYQQGIALAQDNLQSAWTGVSYGSSGVAQNSQCAINGTGSSVSFSGNSVTLNVSITFRPTYAGLKTIYSDSTSNGYASIGAYNVTATAPDFTIDISPSSQNVQAGQSVTYTVTATSLNGFNQDINLSFAYNTRAGNGSATGTFSPAVIPGGNGTSTLTVTPSASATTATWGIGVTGTSQSATHSATAELAVTAVTPPPPPTHTTDSITPQNGSGGSQTFTFVFSSSAGYQDVFNSGPHILFSDGGSSGTDYCWLDIFQGGLFLAQDNLQRGWAPLTYGSNAFVQNSQCLVNGAGSSVSFSGNTVTVNVAITFRPAWAGARTIYSNFNSSNQGYLPVGTYNVTATAPDFTIAVSPGSQSMQAGNSTTYTVTVAPLNSFNQSVALSLEAFASVGSNANVSGSFSPSVIPAGGGTSTLTVTSASSTPASTWQLTVTGTSSTWIHSAPPAQLSVTGPPPPPPPTVSTDSVSPQGGSGSAQIFTFQFSDSAGYSDLLGGKYHVLINTSPSGTASCWFLLESTGLYLAPDDPSQAWSFVSYGSSQNASNSQCGVSGVGTNISGSGNSLTLSLSLTFTPAYTGVQNVYTDVNASNPGYVAATTYTVQ